MSIYTIFGYALVERDTDQVKGFYESVAAARGARTNMASYMADYDLPRGDRKYARRKRGIKEFRLVSLQEVGEIE